MNPELRVSLVQTSLKWEDVSDNLVHFDRLVQSISQPTDLILLPEMFTTGFTMNPRKVAESMEGPTVRWMKRMAGQKKAVIGGSFVCEENGSFFNRYCAISPDGRSVCYDKKHLFGLAGEADDYLAGRERIIYEVNGWKIQSLICYDLRFPVWARSVRKGEQLYEYDLITFSANWPRPRIHAWDVLLQARAIENQAYCLGVNRIGQDQAGMEYPGHSAVYDYLGEGVLVTGEEETVRTVTLEREGLEQFRSHYPFQADSDEFRLSN